MIVPSREGGREPGAAGGVQPRGTAGVLQQSETATGTPAPVADEDLVRRAQAGDRAAFDELVIRYKDRVYNLCWQKLGDAEEALDAAQEAFVKAYKAIGAFELKSKFFTWIFRIAVNCAFSRRRKRVRERRSAPLSLEQAGARGDDCEGDGEGRGIEAADRRDEPAALALSAERARVIAEAIASLDEDHHRIVLLRDVEGLAYEEIAEILDCPVGSVKSRLHRARLVLREKLRGYLAPEA
jgi:RNA polymerase sigma-70 factor (ECF subfamily)